MPEHFEIGDHVWANTGKDDWIGHVASSAFKDENGDTKYRVQEPSGGLVTLGYREPKDRDEAGAGGTFWRV